MISKDKNDHTNTTSGNETASKHYRLALKAKKDYPVALNNLAYAQMKLLNTEEAIELYQKTLSVDSNNDTAKKGLKKLEKRR